MVAFLIGRLSIELGGVFKLGDIRKTPTGNRSAPY
jgi:hypothetical protein